MKVKIKTPELIAIGFTRRELMIIGGCLAEAKSGLLLDRFLPANEQLGAMLDVIRAAAENKDFFNLRRVAA
jgi:hypothetical protein